MLSRAVELQGHEDELAGLVLDRLAGGWSLSSTLSTVRARFGADGEQRAHELIVDGLLRSHGRVRASQA